MSRFLRVFFITGIPFGLFTALMFTIDPPRNWIDFTLSALGSGSVFGLTLGGIAYLFTSSLKNSIGKFLLLVFLLGPTSLVAAPVIYIMGDRLPHAAWVQLPPPPEKAVAFTGPTIRGQSGATIIYIATQQGHYYSFDCRYGGGCYWVMEGEVPTPPQNYLYDKHEMFTNAIPPPPGLAVSSYQVDILGADCWGQSNFLLMADGTIWGWQREWCAIGNLAHILITSIVGLISSILGCFSLLIFRTKGGW